MLFGLRRPLIRGSEDVSDAITKRPTDRLAHSRRHAGIVVLFLLSGVHAEPQLAERLAAARRGIGRESRKERGTRCRPRRATYAAAHRAAVRQSRTPGRAGRL